MNLIDQQENNPLHFKWAEKSNQVQNMKHKYQEIYKNISHY